MFRQQSANAKPIANVEAMLEPAARAADRRLGRAVAAQVLNRAVLIDLTKLQVQSVQQGRNARPAACPRRSGGSRRCWLTARQAGPAAVRTGTCCCRQSCMRVRAQPGPREQHTNRVCWRSARTAPWPARTGSRRGADPAHRLSRVASLQTYCLVGGQGAVGHNQTVQLRVVGKCTIGHVGEQQLLASKAGNTERAWHAMLRARGQTELISGVAVHPAAGQKVRLCVLHFSNRQAPAADAAADAVLAEGLGRLSQMGGYGQCCTDNRGSNVQHAQEGAGLAKVVGEGHFHECGGHAGLLPKRSGHAGHNAGPASVST